MGIMNKMKTVDLGTLTWGYDTIYRRFYTQGINYFWRGIRKSYLQVSSGYVALTNGEPFDSSWNLVVYSGNEGFIYVHNHSYTDTIAFKQSMQGVLLTYETVDSVEEEISYVVNLPFNTTGITEYRNPTSTGTVTITNNLIKIKKDTSDGQIGVITRLTIATPGFFAIKARKLNDKRTILRIYRYNGNEGLGWSPIIHELNEDWMLYIFNDIPINKAEIQILGSAAGAECEFSAIFLIPSTLNTEEIM